MAILLLFAPPTAIILTGWLITSWRVKLMMLIAMFFWLIGACVVMVNLVMIGTGVAISMVEYSPGIHYPYKTTPRLTQGLHQSELARDYATWCGNALYAPINGTVISKKAGGVDRTIASNSHLVIRNGSTVVTLLHGDYYVSTGDSVLAKTTVIGEEASYGNSTGCHTHMEITINGVPVDPETVITK